MTTRRLRPVSGVAAKEIALVMSTFLGLGTLLVGAFAVIYEWPLDSTGWRVQPRRLAEEEPAMVITALVLVVVLAAVCEVVLRRARPRLVRTETARDVAGAAQAAATTLRAQGPDQRSVHHAAARQLITLDSRRWPYKADRIQVTVRGDQLEVVAERSFPTPPGLLLRAGGPGRRLDVRGRASVRTDGTELDRSADVHEAGKSADDGFR